ncbi:MAG: HAD family hydrolase [Candidatus Buchananbacteria bacterium]
MKINKQINWLFFDAGGVLLDETKHEGQRINLILKAVKIFKPEITKDDVLAVRFKASAALGGLTENIIKMFLSDSKNIKQALQFINDHWDKNQSSFVRPDAKNVVEKLAEKFNLGLLANQPIETKERLEKAGVLKYFKFQDVSEDIKLRKPDPEFYKAIFNATGADPKKSSMIDDNIERGLIPAKNLGMTTVWFKQEDREVSAGVVDYTIMSLGDLLAIFN